MSGHRDGQAQRQWVERVLGLTLPPTIGSPSGTTSGGKQVRFAPTEKDASISRSAQGIMRSPPRIGSGLLSAHRNGAKAPIQSGIPTGAKTSFTGAGGKKLDVVIGTDGRVALTAPPPPVQEITFSGGGGKGAALPGAVKAMQESGVLKDAKVLNGASVGSMTAALVAAGITAEDFAAISNDPRTGETISQGRGKVGMVLKGIVGDQLSGEGLESMMREQIGASVHTQIAKYLGTGAPDP
ncbi:MAG TPA: patatin-like phospholipase family protein, partial [Acetobacteraceae bacterium]|nr:patatin-like phospholipase family protein [Acetobacteraceae bacterium]